MVATYAVHYTSCASIRRSRFTPATAANLSATPVNANYVVNIMNADVPARKRGPYKKQVTA